MEPRSTPGPATETLPREVPLFPLPDHVLLPGVESPYRVFEPRYRALLQDLADAPEGDRWISVPRLAPGWKRDYHGAPPFHDVAAIGRLGRCECLDDGHWFITVQGVARGRLVERPTDRPYRMACVEALPDLHVEGDRAALRLTMERIVRAVQALGMLLGPTAQDLMAALSERPDLDRAVWRLAAGAIDGADERQRLLEERHPVRRAERVHQALVDLVGLAGRHCGPMAEA
ncbi:MAG: LON peptidase substrate-binding domain-containing protein [Myxococcota bacterium]